MDVYPRQTPEQEQVLRALVLEKNDNDDNKCTLLFSFSLSLSLWLRAQAASPGLKILSQDGRRSIR